MGRVFTVKTGVLCPSYALPGHIAALGGSITGEVLRLAALETSEPSAHLPLVFARLDARSHSVGVGSAGWLTATEGFTSRTAIYTGLSATRLAFRRTFLGTGV